MPCRGPDHPYELASRQPEIDKLTRIACELARKLPEFAVGMLSTETQNWIEEHKRVDAEREARYQREQAQKRVRDHAIGKLTDEERKALGI